MTSYALEELFQLVWVPDNGIADITAPTAGELNAGTVVDLTPIIPPDGWNPGLTNNPVDDSDLTDATDKSVPGTYGASPTLTGKKQLASADDDLWSLAERGVEGFLVERRGVAHGASFAASQEVLVIKVILGDPQPAATGRNALSTFSVPTHIQGLAVKATVAA